MSKENSLSKLLVLAHIIKITKNFSAIPETLWLGYQAFGWWCGHNLVEWAGSCPYKIRGGGNQQNNMGREEWDKAELEEEKEENTWKRGEWKKGKGGEKADEKTTRKGLKNSGILDVRFRFLCHWEDQNGLLEGGHTLRSLFYRVGQQDCSNGIATATPPGSEAPICRS